ncbi:MAG: Gfo/Idh/MocA family oxidoreductase [Victivallales bacterium]|nr:Gfo/Idh/MocA family oxidoreductase [Victivallales bacterium]
MPSNVSVALVGLGGYGNHYLGEFFNSELPGHIKLVAVVDPNPVSCEHLAEIKAAGLPLFPDLDAMYKDIKPDLVIIAAPIHLHTPMTCKALEMGSHVLCEKPLAATLDDAVTMLEAQESSGGRQVAVGYQWSYAPATIRLKKDIMGGRFGRPLRMKTISLWPRMASYYARAPWAGRIKLGGNYVMDSPVTNATAHYLHNMLYLLGAEDYLAAVPEKVTAEIYRAKETENYDTGMVRVITESGVEVLFYTTHSCKHQIGPLLQFDFEDASIVFAGGAGEVYIARFKGGTVENYGSPNDMPEAKVVLTVDSILDGGRFRCDARAACSHLMVTNAIQKSAADIPVFPSDLVKEEKLDNDSLVYASALDEVMLQCYSSNILPSEFGSVHWARPASEISISPDFKI